MNPVLKLVALASIVESRIAASTHPRFAAPQGSTDKGMLPRRSLDRDLMLPVAPPPVVVRPPPPKYKCPKCSAPADTPRRCNPCGVVVRRYRGPR